MTILNKNLPLTPTICQVNDRFLRNRLIPFYCSALLHNSNNEDLKAKDAVAVFSTRKCWLDYQQNMV